MTSTCVPGLIPPLLLATDSTRTCTYRRRGTVMPALSMASSASALGRSAYILLTRPFFWYFFTEVPRGGLLGSSLAPTSQLRARDEGAQPHAPRGVARHHVAEVVDAQVHPRQAD